ncbi:hypothetical protein CL630_01750 [bacterium]|nr:hypothetical protein [bacterium]|tara:strand:+ start:9078 stop:10598 length:1521 start_codon:yes stop_codon:yes gene_type:complete
MSSILRKKYIPLTLAMLLLLPFFVVGLVTLVTQSTQNTQIAYGQLDDTKVAEILSGNYFTGRYGVVFKETISMEQGRSIVEGFGGVVRYELPLSRVFVIQIDDSERMILERHLGVEWFEQEVARIPLASVYVLDSPAGGDVQYASQSSILPGASPIDRDDNKHGTFVASAVADMSSQLGIDTQIHSINIAGETIFTPKARKKEFTDMLVAEGVREAVKNGADVINISLGAYDGMTENERNAFDEAEAAGVTIVVSAGNCSDSCGVNDFTNHSAVISVGALKPDGSPAEHYTDGLREGQKAFVFANGTLDTGEGLVHGTSIAAPRIAAAVGGIKQQPIGEAFDKNGESYDKNGNGKWDTNEIEARLKNGIENGEYPFKLGADLKDPGAPEEPPQELPPETQPSSAPSSGSSSGGLPGGATDLFGGKMTKVIVCTCDLPWRLFTVGPPVRGTFMIDPSGTPPLYEYKRIAKGVWTLGIAAGSKTCFVKGDPCPPVGSGPIVKIMGTSR